MWPENRRDARTGDRRYRGSGGPLSEAATVAASAPATRKAIVFPTDQPAGTLATRIAGCAELYAAFEWRSPCDLPAAPNLAGPAIKATWTEDHESATRTLNGEIIGLTRVSIAANLEETLRGISAYAALTEAVLQIRVVHRAPPRAVPSAMLGDLARDLYGAGFSVRFAPYLTPTPGVGVPLGVRGAEKELAEFLRAHRDWELA